MIKVLTWDGSGLCLYAKKLERGTFPWPREGTDAQATTLSADDLALILAGVDPVTAPRQRGWWRCAPTRVAS
ncbi:MAG: IS66 family insertion sequence element accessory protein TnpB, partial [Myxococcota bacterium]|nr:IS66 family insertion sequence element accessory protein TnpB [Myxococcota bacterium]